MYLYLLINRHLNTHLSAFNNLNINTLTYPRADHWGIAGCMLLGSATDGAGTQRTTSFTQRLDISLRIWRKYLIASLTHTAKIIEIMSVPIIWLQFNHSKNDDNQLRLILSQNPDAR